MHLRFQRTPVNLVSGAKLFFTGEFHLSTKDRILIVGDNASGKTTLLMLLMSLASQHAFGHIVDYDQNLISRMRSDNTHCRCPINACFVFQEPRDNFVCRTSADEVILPLLSAYQDASKLLEELNDLVDAADVYRRPLWSRPIDTLSSGEQQRVAVCSALASTPEWMLWDEALARVDEHSSERLVHLMDNVFSDGILLAATHRPQRYFELFGDRITSIISIRRNGNEIVLNQTKVCDQVKNAVPTFEEMNFADRKLWGEYANVDSTQRLFNNGFRVFGSKAGQPIACFNTISLRVGRKGNELELASLNKASLSKGINFVVGRNGSGKSLFLELLAGRYTINPFFTYSRSISATGNYASERWPSLKNLNKVGQSVYLAAEPHRWLTEDTVESEIRQLNPDPSRRLEILKSHGIEGNADLNQLSYGQRKFVATLSLPPECELVCLDEPFADLGVEFIEALEDFLLDQAKNDRWKIIMISHSSDVLLTDKSAQQANL